jgi:hypothetical protein
VDVGNAEDFVFVVLLLLMLEAYGEVELGVSGFLGKHLSGWRLEARWIEKRLHLGGAFLGRSSTVGGGFGVFDDFRAVRGEKG